MKHEALVTRVVPEAPGISTIFFTVNGKTFAYTAGQYISIYFDNTNHKSGKAYSLSSAPRDYEMSVTVKNIGLFSGLICSLQPGDHFQISSPFGHFNAQDDTPIIAIAASIGVAPIWSIVRDELETNRQRDITVYLTACHEEELVFRTRMNELFVQHPYAKAHYFVTQGKSSLAKRRRFTVKTDLSPAACATSRFYICGSEQFVRSIWEQLMEANIPKERIVTETFFESHP